MASKFILIVKDGGIVKRAIRKPQAPRKNLIAWLGIAAAEALQWKAKHYAFRHSGKWHVLGVDLPQPLKTFPAENQAAAEMWLVMRAGRV